MHLFGKGFNQRGRFSFFFFWGGGGGGFLVFFIVWMFVFVVFQVFWLFLTCPSHPPFFNPWVS